ncbi:MipA/OmpV family protein [Massilia sp. HP4]|uniref:MipA/OmpV family protein n=1 Tax=Massilia sp. HP4 TaxID=2562316 RepID=UPI0010C09EB3|nr:MipA/OmpV family protein [Massilia sp. HP4]
MPPFASNHRRHARNVPACAAALAIAALACPVWAQDHGAAAWALGGGVAVVQKGYRDVDRDVLAVPLIAYESKWISATVPTLDLKAWSNERLSLRLRARYARDGYEPDDSQYLTGMAERKGGVWLGGAMHWRTPVANVSAELLHDAGGHSKAVRAKVQVERRYAFGAFGITPRLGAEWFDRDYVDYYYGVRAGEARAGRAAYEGDASVNAEAGLRVDYSYARQHTVFVDVRASHFGSAIKDSPLTDRARAAGVSLGYLYRF